MCRSETQTCAQLRSQHIYACCPASQQWHYSHCAKISVMHPLKSCNNYPFLHCSILFPPKIWPQSVNVVILLQQKPKSKESRTENYMLCKPWQLKPQPTSICSILVSLYVLQKCISNSQLGPFLGYGNQSKCSRYHNLVSWYLFNFWFHQSDSVDRYVHYLIWVRCWHNHKNWWQRPFNVLMTEWLVTSKKEHVAAHNNWQILLIILPVPSSLGRGISLSILQQNCSWPKSSKFPWERVQAQHNFKIGVVTYLSCFSQATSHSRIVKILFWTVCKTMKELELPWTKLKRVTTNGAENRSDG
jgi:hypothetical protein